MASVRRDAALRQIDRLFDEGTLAGLSDIRLLERYIAHRDELAFEALVRRHGPMVLGVCRRVLDDSNDADDAFQAAFLLLARKARSIRADGTLGGWLHRVAWRIAIQLRCEAARRRDQERRAAELAGELITYGAGQDDSAAVIHQEIDRLPDRYRRPVVLCYLEDMTYQRAASHLRWSEATTRGRLARARELLRARLSRRGVTLAGAGLSIAGASSSQASAVSGALIRTTVRARRQIALGEAATGAVSTTSIVLMKQAARGMMIARFKAIAAAALAIATLAGLASVLAASMAGNEGTRPSVSRPIVKEVPAPLLAEGPEKAGVDETIVFRGRVLAPDGKPAAGAAISTVAPRPGEDDAEPILRAKAAQDGTFRFAIAREAFDDVTGRSPWSMLTVLASAEGLGLDWVEVHDPPRDELTLRLVDDSVPIAGRILDLQGRPVVGAKVTRGRIVAEGPEGIDPYLRLMRDDPMAASNHRFARSYHGAYGLPGRPSSVVTDAQGRFRLAGIGRDRIVDLNVEGPTIQSATVAAMTRDAAAVSMPKTFFRPRTVHGATFDGLTPPGRALTGVVTDRRTGRPLAGVKVAGKETNARTTTDAGGRYTLPGFPKGKSYGLTVLASLKPPYFVTCRDVSDTAGLDPLRTDVDCEPGIPMRLKLIDKETGQAPKRAEVTYWPLYPNPHTREVPGLAPVQSSGAYSVGALQADGTYLLGVLPGPGAVRVLADGEMYRPACVDPAAFFKDGARAGGDSRFGNRKWLVVAQGDDGRSFSPQEVYSAIVLVNPPEGSGPITAESVLERDRKREVRVLGPDGALAAGATAQDFAAPERYEGIEATATPGVLAIWRLNPMRPRRFLFRHDGRKLVGCLVARGDESEPYTVKLQPWATLTGRLIDAQGHPRPDVQLFTSAWQEDLGNPARGLLPTGLKTDKPRPIPASRGLVPRREYSGIATSRKEGIGYLGTAIDRVVLEPGQTRDLGDVRARPARPESDR